MSGWILVIYTFMFSPVVIENISEADCYFYREYAVELAKPEVDLADRVSRAECLPPGTLVF
jgi:hypothetical protein